MASLKRSNIACYLLLFVAAGAMLAAGCTPPEGTTQEDKPPRENIIGRTTSDVGEYDPDAENQVTDPESDGGNMFTYPLHAYGPIAGRVASLQVQQAVNLFWGAEGRYPKDYDEFIERVLLPNNIELPVLPGDAQYKYDVENHELVVVAPEEDN